MSPRMRPVVNCPECGLTLAIVGRNHLCRPVTNTSVTNNVAAPVTNSVGRVMAWRAAHPDRYRAYKRTYMAKRRAVLAQR